MRSHLIGGAFATLLSTNAAGSELPCPSSHPGQFFPFDNTRITFDSTRVKIQKGQLSGFNCVAIEKAVHEYRVDWQDANLGGVYTEKGTLTSATYIDNSAAPEESVAFVGTNRTKFTPKLLKDKPFLTKLGDSFLSLFEGGVSTVSRERSEQERAGKVVPVKLEFECRLSGSGSAELRFVNNGPLPPGGIGFSFPEGSRRGLEGLTERLKIGSEGRSIEYKIDGGEPAAKTVAITLLNSDYQDIGSIPITIIASSENR